MTKSLRMPKFVARVQTRNPVIKSAINGNFRFESADLKFIPNSYKETENWHFDSNTANLYHSNN